MRYTLPMPSSLSLQEKQFRQNLRNLLRKDGRSQAEAARSIGIHPSQLSLYLSGKADVYGALLFNILSAAGIDLNLVVEQALRPRARSGRLELDETSRLLRRLTPFEQKATDRMVRRMLQLKDRA